MAENYQKANYAERQVGVLKRKLEQIASYSGHSDWSKYYKQAIQTLNRTKHSRTTIFPRINRYRFIYFKLPFRHLFIRGTSLIEGPVYFYYCLSKFFSSVITRGIQQDVTLKYVSKCFNIFYAFYLFAQSSTIPFNPSLTSKTIDFENNLIKYFVCDGFH